MSEAREVVEAELAEVIEGSGAYVTDAWRAAEELYESGWRKTGGDDVIERAARALCAAAGENPDSNELWDEEPPWLYYKDEARAMLTAALGGDDD